MTYNRCRALLVIASRRRWRLPAALSVHAWSHGPPLQEAFNRRFCPDVKQTVLKKQKPQQR